MERMKVPMEEQLQQIPGPSSVLGTDGTRRWTLEFLGLKEDLSPPTGRGAVGEKNPAKNYITHNPSGSASSHRSPWLPWRSLPSPLISTHLQMQMITLNVTAVVHVL